MKKYEPDVIMKLCAAMREEDGAQQWLVDNGYRELSEFWDAYEKMERSFKWLLDNNHRELAALIDGLQGEEHAKVWLMKNGHPELAAVIDASDGNKTAVLWLSKSVHKAWLAVAKEIYLINKKKEKKGFLGLFDFGNPYS